MKALTIRQPWASLVAHGLKTIETRSWKTNYRGRILIHAAHGMSNEEQELLFIHPEISKALRSVGIVNNVGMPRGCIIASAEIYACVTVETVNPLGDERSFGDYTPGRYAWCLGDIRKLDKPILVKGQLGLWNWAGDIDGQL